jgi:NTP pyrophosphatase (non-canonical NTP hydrolase)
MNDQDTRLVELKERILDFARERDWEQFHSPKNLSMAIAAEAAELMEHFLWDESSTSVRRLEDSQRRSQIEEELSDVIIFALEFANMTGIDVARSIEAKMATNAQKYPAAKARGRSEKYTEL